MPELFKLPYTCAFQARFGEQRGEQSSYLDVTIWLSRTIDNSNIFIRSREVPDNESRLYIFWRFGENEKVAMFFLGGVGLGGGAGGEGVIIIS